MSTHAPNEARVIPLRPHASPPASDEQGRPPQAPARREPLWRNVVGDVLRRERLAQERTLKDVAEAARISMPYLSELERGRKEASSEVLAAAAWALGLGLADLLSLAQDELARYAAPSRMDRGRSGHGLAGRGRTSPTGRYDGLCLVA
ncbi:helix-turn-helix transcriptional regulator [Kitasatospora sp. NPDC005856]|uniref:helix-turn-helix domain-containing protein n=1 Tax=Kitasatospora sp. NPDC005856 TaxID=3154566 RepID=UPI0033F374C9